MDSLLGSVRRRVVDLRKIDPTRAYRADRIAVLAAALADCFGASDDEVRQAALWGWIYGGWTVALPTEPSGASHVVGAVQWALLLDEDTTLAEGVSDPGLRERMMRVLGQLTPFDADA